MLRITQLLNDVRTLRVEGRLSGAGVAELSRVVRPLLDNGVTFRLDAEQLTFVDQPGADLLRSLAAAGVELTGCSEFVRTLIAGAAS